MFTWQLRRCDFAKPEDLPRIPRAAGPERPHRVEAMPNANEEGRTIERADESSSVLSKADLGHVTLGLHSPKHEFAP